MNKKTLLSLIFALGCAAADDMQDEQLGTDDQPLMSAHTGAMQFGFQPASEITCNTVSATQICIVPSTKDLRFVLTGGSVSQRSAVRSQVNLWYTSMVAHGLSQDADAWTFSETTDINDIHLTLVIDVDTGTGFCAGSSAETQDFSCFSGSVTNLIEASGIKGNYRRWTAVPVLHIDYDDIQNNGSLNSQQKANLQRQAVWSGLDRFIGIGLVVVGDNRCNSSVPVVNSPCVIRDAQACAANSFGDDGNQIDWFFGGPDCGQ